MKICASAGIQSATPCFPACRFNHSAIQTVNGMLLKLLHYIFMLLSLNTYDNASMKLVMVWFVYVGHQISSATSLISRKLLDIKF